MKLKYIFMSMVMAATSMAGFTSCSDDDEPAPAPVTEKTDLVLANDVQRVKIGPENRVLIEVTQGNGEYQAYSLNPDIADIVIGDDGQYYIEGFKNGKADVVVSDAGNNYKRLAVSVYTTDVMQLSHDTYSFVTVLGKSATSTECSVALGNGGYTIESDNSKVRVSIDAETGAISLTATSAKDEYTANVTVTDITGLTATMAVTVKATFDPFVQSELDELLAMTSNAIDYNGDYFYYFNYYGDSMTSKTENGITQTGWSYNYYGYYNFSHVLAYPEGTAVGVEVDGSLITEDWDNKRTYDGKVKILADDDKHFVGIYYKVDLDNERIDRGYVVWVK